MYDWHDYSQWHDGQTSDFALFQTMKPTNLDIKDAACLYVVHILQHPTCCPTTRSTQDTMVNAPNIMLSPIPAGQYGKSTKKSTWRRYQENKGKSGLEAEKVWASGALRRLPSKKNLSPEKWREMHFPSNEKKEKWIQDYVDRETAVERKRVEDAETAIMQEQEDMRNVEMAQSTAKQPETTFEELLNAIGYSLSNLASSEDEADGEGKDDDEENTELGKLSKDDEPGWVMGTISKMVQHCMESFRQKQMRRDTLTQTGWGDAADLFSEREVKYGMTELMVPAVVKPQTVTTTATPSRTTFGELMQVHDIVPRQSRMLQLLCQ